MALVLHNDFGPNTLLAHNMNPQPGTGQKRIWHRWKLVTLLAALICTMVVWFLSNDPQTTGVAVPGVPVVADPLPPVHPVFGTAHKTVGVDRFPRPLPAQSESPFPRVKMVLNYVMKHGRSMPEPTPIRRNLLIGQTEMLWSSGGYLYFHLLYSDRPLWEFAPCYKTNLSQVRAQDLVTKFACEGDKTNGPVAFGPNWLGNAIRVSEGQVVFARPLGDPTRVYALEITKQVRERVVVYYFEMPL